MSDFDISSEPGQVSAEVSAVVKWINSAKGFGFVQPDDGSPDDGSPDAFLHASVVERSGHNHLPEGAALVCDISEGPRGQQVAAIHSVELPQGGAVEGTFIIGTVKFFDPVRGFGFVAPDDGGRDGFVSGRSLERSGIQALETSQRVRVSTGIGKKGPMAESVEVL